jgi:hypothetical protein
LCQSVLAKELPHLPYLIRFRLAVPERLDIHDLGQARLPEDMMVTDDSLVEPLAFK